MVPLHQAVRNRRAAPRRVVVSLLAGLSTLTLPLLAVASPSTAGGRPALRSCAVAGLPAKCGSLQVYEDRVSGTGRTMSVGFVVMPAVDKVDRLPDPVVYFAGGPGGAATEDIQAQAQALGGLNLRHDLVFVDQRGTGRSHPLVCAPLPPGLDDKPALREALASCLARVDANIGYYTTAMAVDDIAQVLSSLGYTRANLVGGSYGVTAEQVFLLRHPEMVRTMTLVSGSLLGIPMFERFPTNARAALDDVFARCQRSAACHKAFPHLSAEWASIVASLRKSPWVVPAKLSPTKKTFYYTEEVAAQGLHQALMSTRTEAYLPVLVHSLATNKDHAAAIVAASKALASAHATSGAGAGRVPIIGYPIRCTEAWARYDPAKLSGKSAFEYSSDLADAKWWRYVCSLLPPAPGGTGYGATTPSDVPVLAFNGTADPQDPPANMAGAAKVWPNSRMLVMPGQSHQTDLSTWQRCGSLIVQDFVQQAGVRHLDTSCLAVVPLPPFVLSLQALAGS